VDYVKYDSCSYGRIAGFVYIEDYAKILPPADAEKLRALPIQERLSLESIPAKRTADEKAKIDQSIKDWERLVAKANPEELKRVNLLMRQLPYIKFRQSLDKVQRDIVYSLCQYGMADVWEWGAKIGGNAWRTTVDIGPNYATISGIGFAQNGLENFPAPATGTIPTCWRSATAT